MKASVTCLIPYYNEGDRIINTLTILSKIKLINEIICVNDGSTDNATKNIHAVFPHIKVIGLNSNYGKAAAIEAGLESITSDYVLLFDADLSNIKTKEIENALVKIQGNNTIDMIILRRIIESKFLSLIRHDIVMSGQRVLRTTDLKSVFKSNPRKYEIEMAINAYMIERKKKVFWMPLSTKNQKKVFKMGFIKSLGFYGVAIKGFITFSGIKGYINQVTKFCKEEAR